MIKLMEKTKIYTFIDLFAGAGGLSEGFVRAGFTPLAHIEMDKNACNTLKTRSAFHYLQKNGMLSIYPQSVIRDGVSTISNDRH